MGEGLSGGRPQVGYRETKVRILHTSDLAQLTDNSLIRDAGYFKARISKIDEAGDIGDFLLKIAEEKSVVSTTSLPATNGTNPTTAGAKS